MKCAGLVSRGLGFKIRDLRCTGRRGQFNGGDYVDPRHAGPSKVRGE